MYSDSTLSEKRSYKINSYNKWETIYMPLSLDNIISGNSPESVIGVVFSQNSEDGNEHIIYIDDIEFLSENEGAAITAKPEILSCAGYGKHVDISWQSFSNEQVKYVKIYRSENSKTFIPVGIQSPAINRYADYTGVTGKAYSYKISFLKKVKSFYYLSS